MTLQIGDRVIFHNPELEPPSTFENEIGTVIGREGDLRVRVEFDNRHLGVFIPRKGQLLFERLLQRVSQHQEIDDLL